MLTILSGISLLLPFAIAIITFGKQDKTLKKLSVFIFIVVALEALSFYLNYNGQHNLFLFHIFTYIEGIAYASIYYDILKGYKKTLIPYLIIIFLLFSIVNSINWEHVDIFNSIQRTVGGVIILFYALSYFVQLFQEAEIQKIERDTFFSMSSALLLYTSGTLFLFILANEALTPERNEYWDVHSVLNIILNIGFTLTLWIGTRKSN